MKIKKTKFKDLLILENKSFNDKRGFFKELFKEKLIFDLYPYDWNKVSVVLLLSV